MQRRYTRYVISLAALIAILLFAVAYSLSAGELHIPLVKIPSLMFSEEHTAELVIIGKIRLPRVIMGICVGGALSLAGVLLQGIYRNPLVEPYTLGISGGASLGVSLSIVAALHLRWGNSILPAAGFAGALLTIFLVYRLSISQKKLVVYKMVLIGVMISFISSSLMMLLMATTTTENLHGIIFWMMGSLDETDPLLLKIVVITSLSCMVLSLLFARPLNALRLGENEARHMGINTDLTIKILFVMASLLTGASVAIAGVIGFVGLIIPQFLRLVAGSDFRFLMPGAFIFGGAFLVFCDTLARTIIAPNEIPIGVITGILGGTGLVIVLLRKELQNTRL